MSTPRSPSASPARTAQAGGRRAAAACPRSPGRTGPWSANLTIFSPNFSLNQLPATHHMPLQRQLLSTAVDPQSGRSSQRGWKLRPVCAVSLRGSGFIAQAEPAGTVPSTTYVPLNQTCERFAYLNIRSIQILIEPLMRFRYDFTYLHPVSPAEALQVGEGERGALETFLGEVLVGRAEAVLVAPAVVGLHRPAHLHHASRHPHRLAPHKKL